MVKWKLAFLKRIQTHYNITQKSRKIRFRLVCWLFPFSSFITGQKKKPTAYVIWLKTCTLHMCVYVYFCKNNWMYTDIRYSSQSGFASIQFTWGSLCKITQFFETHLCLYHHSNVHPFWMFWLHTAHTRVNILTQRCCIHKITNFNIFLNVNLAYYAVLWQIWWHFNVSNKKNCVDINVSYSKSHWKSRGYF